MQWIKYQIVQSVIDEETILIEKKVGYSEANLAIAQAEAYNGEYTIEEDGTVFNKEPLAIEFGGTGADTAEQARANLGAASTQDIEDLTGYVDYLATRSPSDMGAQPKNLTFRYKSVQISEWESDTTYTNYPYRAAVECAAVTEGMFAEVVFAPDDATSGNFAPVCDTYTGGVYLYAEAVPDAELTIPIIVCMEVL